MDHNFCFVELFAVTVSKYIEVLFLYLVWKLAATLVNSHVISDHIRCTDQVMVVCHVLD